MSFLSLRDERIAGFVLCRREIRAERLVAKTLLLFGNFHLFRCFRLDISRAERFVAKTSLLFRNFHLFHYFRLDISWSADWCVDAAVTVRFSFIFLYNSLALLRPTRPS